MAIDLIVDTPNPNAVLGPPTNAPWTSLYEYYWETWIPIMLFLWAAMIGLVIFFESTSHLFGSYHRSKLKRRAFSGLLGILAWWWIAAISLRFMDALAGVILPALSDIALFETLSFSTMGVLGLVVALTADLILFVLIGLIYVVRQVVLYLFVLLMPLLIVFWIPGVGPFALASQFMKRLAGFYVPFLFMTIPVALLFRLGAIMGENFGLSMSGFGAWLIALVIPLVAVLSPFVLFWQAGAIFFMADRAFQHTSSQRARQRVGAAKSGGQRIAQGTRNVAGGIRDQPAGRQNGQTVPGGSGSRALPTGQRRSSTTPALPGSLSGGNSGSGGNGSGRGGGESHSNTSPSSGDTGTRSAGGASDHSDDGWSTEITQDPLSKPEEDFENLRPSNRSQSRPRDDSPSTDDGTDSDHRQ